MKCLQNEISQKHKSCALTLIAFALLNGYEYGTILMLHPRGRFSSLIAFHCIEYRFLNPFYICDYSNLMVFIPLKFLRLHYFIPFDCIFLFFRHLPSHFFIGEILLFLSPHILSPSFTSCIRMYIYGLIRFMCHHNFVMCTFMALCLNYLFLHGKSVARFSRFSRLLARFAHHHYSNSLRV